MISAATGAMALVMVTLVKGHGLQYLLAATLLCDVLQIGAGLLKLGLLMRFVSRSVLTGFVNALAILIFMAQLPELIGVTCAGLPLSATERRGLRSPRRRTMCAPARRKRCLTGTVATASHFAPPPPPR